MDGRTRAAHAARHFASADAGRRVTLVALTLMLGLALPGAAQATAPGRACAAPSWVAGWYGAPVQTVPGLSDRTYRSLTTVHYPGRQLRVRLTNALGSSPVHVDAVTVAQAATGAAAIPASTRIVRFHGKPGVTVLAGRDVVSDPVPLAVAGMAKVAVSFFAAGSTGPLTAHSSEPQDAFGPPTDVVPMGGAMESHVSFLSTPGDHTRDESGTWFVQPDTSAALVDGVDVLPSTPTAGVVALGDSITDGFESTPEADASWPDDVSRRLLGAGVHVALVNAGISGGQVVGKNGRGPNALARMTRDVLSQSGVRAVIVLEGINDIGNGATANQVIAGYRALIRAAHDRGLTVYGGLLTPSGDTTRPFVSPAYSDAKAVATRHQVNAWTVNSGAFDGVIDFDQAVADPAAPEHWRTGYSADDLHGNDAGYRLMAGAVPAKVLARLRPCGGS